VVLAAFLMLDLLLAFHVNLQEMILIILGKAPNKLMIRYL